MLFSVEPGNTNRHAPSNLAHELGSSVVALRFQTDSRIGDPFALSQFQFSLCRSHLCLGLPHLRSIGENELTQLLCRIRYRIIPANDSMAPGTNRRPLP